MNDASERARSAQVDANLPVEPHNRKRLNLPIDRPAVQAALARCLRRKVTSPGRPLF